MSPPRRLAFLGSTLCLWVLAKGVALGGWEFTPAAEPNRNWGVSVTQSGMYDDNFNASENNRQSGFRYNSDVVLRANVPWERLFVGLNFDYGLTYPQDVVFGGINESYNVNVLANYTISPRLTLSLNNQFVDSLQPELVQTQAGVPFTIVQAGTYIYDSLGGNLNYALAPRWNLVLNGNWDIWRYQVSSIASNNDREDYSTTLSALYSLDERTTVGVNYQYGESLFANPGTNNALNAQSHTAYLSLVRRFNPRLSLQLNSGYTLREGGDGSQSSSPSELASLVYNYGPVDTISLTFAYSLSQANLAGGFRQFSASENTSAALQLSHQLSARLSAEGDVAYVYSSFVTPIQTFQLSAQEQQLLAHLSLTYAFRVWLSAVFNYQYTRLTSDIPGAKYERNQISLGMSVNY